MWPFLSFSVWFFGSSQSTEDLVAVVSDRIARGFSRSGATRAVAVNISKFDRVWHAFFHLNIRFMEFQVRYLYLLRYWGCLSLLNWIEVLTLSLLLKLCQRQLELWFVLWSFSLLICTLWIYHTTLHKILSCLGWWS